MMHKLSKQLLSLLLSVMLVVSMSSVAFAAEEDEYTSSGGQIYGSYTNTSLLSGDIYYGELSPMAKRLYNGLKDAMTNPTNSWRTIEFPLNQANWNDFDDETLITAYSALRNEWPELFQWVDLKFAYLVESNNVSWRVSYFLSVQDAYRGASHTYYSPNGDGSYTACEYWDIKPQTVNAQQKAAEAKAAQVLAAAPAGDDYDKVVYFNNWIINNTEYDFDGIKPGQPYDNTYHIAGVFLDGKAVCEGYAKALKYLCDKSGIECLYITGNLVVPGEDPGPHAWNYVKLDGAWYIVDPTNNDLDAPNRNIALCIGTNDFWSSLLVPDGAYDIENNVLVSTPNVPLSTDNYGDRAKSITFTAPTKTEYLPGEALDLTGGSILVTRYNGKTDETPIPMTADMLSGLDMNKVGVQQVTVSYNGKVAANKLAITVKNVPVSASVHEAVVNYAIGVSSLDLSEGYAKVTYADNTVARPRLNDTTKVQVAVAIGVSGLEAGKHIVTVTILDQNKNFVTTYEIGVGEDNVVPELPGEPNPNPPSTGGGGGRGTSSNVVNALPPDKAIAQLKAVDPKSPPAGSKALTVGGKSILTLPMAIPTNGMIDIGTVTQLGALPAGVGVVINQGSGKPELLIPGGFKFTAEPGQFALPLLVTNDLSAEAKAAVTAALGANRTLVYSGTLGGSTIVKFPTAFTVMVPVKLAEGTSVTVQMVNPATGKVLSTVTVKVVNGMVSFPTTTTGGIVLSVAK